MNAPHLHLMLNHLPIIGFPIALGILCVGIWRREQIITTLALSLVIIFSLASIPVYLSGEGAEEAVEQLIESEEEFIEAHEEAAGVAFSLALTSGVIALGALFRASLIKLMLLTLCLTCGALFWTGKLGGEIRHPEIRTEQR